MRNNGNAVIACILSVALFSGCASSTVLGRPKAKNLSALQVGTSRGLVLAELGAPAYSKETDGEKVDTFSFDKGVSSGYKFGRGLFHVAADLFTVFLWEIVAWPAEKIAAGPNTKVEVAYDRNEKVKTVNYLALK